MTDRYTKAVLTVIAVALVVIAFELGTPRAGAVSEVCGAEFHPCYIATAKGSPIEVTVSR